MIILLRYVFDCNERRRLDLTCAYARSEETEENEKSQAEGPESGRCRACPAKDSQTLGYVRYTYLAVFAIIVI